MNPKLFAFILVCYTSCFLNISAQEKKDFKQEIQVGVNFGANLTDASFGTSFSNSPFKTKMWQRWAGGVSVKYLVEKNLGLIMEINYSQQGWEQDFSNPDASESEKAMLATFQYHRQLNYLQVPILTHIYFGNKVRFNFNLGPQISFLLNNKEEINEALSEYLASGNVSSSTTTEEYYRKIDKTFEYGLLGGLGVEFRTGVGFFVLEGRYIFGLSDFFNNSKTDPFQRSANRNISIKATYYFKIK